MPLKIAVDKGFIKQKNKLKKQSGMPSIIHSKLVEAMKAWTAGKESILQRTHHGETRLDHCVKYQLSNDHRLVTVEHEGYRVLVAVGKHEEIDRWLKDHRGVDFAVDRNGRVELVDIAPPNKDGLLDIEHSAFVGGPVLSRLDSETLGKLELDAGLAIVLENITSENVEEEKEKTWGLLLALGYKSEAQKNTVIEVFGLLCQGLDQKARMVIDLYAKEAVLAGDDSEAFIEAIDSGSASDRFVDATDLNATQLADMFYKLSYADWLLFLDPEQDKLVKAETKGPSRIVGVSGSGKTCVLVHRAKELALRYPQERILIMALKQPIARLINNLISQLCSEEEAANIECMRIYDYCHLAVSTIRPDIPIANYDERSGEDLDIAWGDFTRQRDQDFRRAQRTLMTPLSLKEVDAWEYLRDELIWIRSGFSEETLQDYHDCERTGRGITFPKTPTDMVTYGAGHKTNTGFLTDTRHRVIKILERWQEYLTKGGLMDEDGVALLASKVRHEIRHHNKLTARCVLVDEVQDCSTTQLSVIANIPTAEEDGLYLVGDPVQKVFPKQHHLANAGIDIRGRSTILRTNYRNTRQVLEAAYQIIDAFKGKCPVPDDEVLLPKYATRDGTKPRLVLCSQPNQQVQAVKKHIGEVLAHEAGTICAASITNHRLARLKRDFERSNQWTCRNLTDGSTLKEIEESVMLAQFDDMKGHEFRYVYLMDLGEKALKLRSIPKEERWRIAFQIYVAMTRAQDELWLFCQGQPSQLIEPIIPYVEVIKAEQWLAD